MATRSAGMAGVALTLCAPIMLSSVGVAHAEPAASESASAARAEEGVPIPDLVATVAKKTGKKFVLDPKVHGSIEIIGQDPSAVSYNDLITVLGVHGYIAVETSGYVKIIPDAVSRQEAIPVITGNSKESYPDSEVVTKIITPKNIPAAHLVPILRPILPQSAHLAAFLCTNKLLIVDTYANVKRLQTIIDAMDVGEPYKSQTCDTAPFQSSSK